MKYSHGSDGANRKMHECVERCAGALSGPGGVGALCAILTGSLSRGEGSIMEKGGGRIECLGDMEFIAVVEEDKGFSEKRRRALALEAEVAGRLASEGVDCKVEYTLAFRRYFTNARPSIFAYELKHHGKVISGPESMLDEMPDFPASDIPRLDAFHLLCNRIVEQLDAYAGLEAGRIPVEQFVYAITKFYLDIATSVLTFQGKYVSTYADRATALRFLDLPRRLGCPSLSGLADKVEFWTRFKLRPSKEALRSIDRDGALNAWRELAGYALSVWLWELKELLGTNEDDMLKLGERFVKELGPKGRKARGLQWLKFGYRAVRAAKFRDLFFVRYLSGDPRHMLYMEAALLYFSLSGAGSAVKKTSGGFLPVRKFPAGDEALARELIRIWTLYFRNN